MSTKPKIFNLALSALLLTKQISDTDGDASTENRVLNVNWDVALQSTLADLDLDATATEVILALIAECPEKHWRYAYKYPDNCAFFRRIKSHVRKDNKSTLIKKQVSNYNNKKVILCNHHDAVAEIIPFDLSLSLLNAQAALCVAYKLAILAAPLISGKGALELKKQLEQSYAMAKISAQQIDREENATFDEDWVISEFVEARLF